MKQPGVVEPDQGKSGSGKKEPTRKTSLTRIRDGDGRRGKKAIPDQIQVTSGEWKTVQCWASLVDDKVKCYNYL